MNGWSGRQDRGEGGGQADLEDDDAMGTKTKTFLDKIKSQHREKEKTLVSLYSTLLYSTLLYSTLLYSTLLYSTLLYSTILYYTLSHYTVLYYTILYYTILYYTVLQYAMLYGVGSICFGNIR